MADNKYLSKTELVEFIKNLSLIYATNEKADAVKVKTQLNEKLLPALVNAFSILLGLAMIQRDKFISMQSQTL